MQADLLIKVILPASLFLIMYGIGISLRIADFKGIVRNPRAVAIWGFEPSGHCGP